MRRAATAALIALLAGPGVCAAQSKSRSAFITTTDRVRIHYLEAGDGPAMLFVPGLTMTASIWESQIAFFSRTHRVVAMDPRSQGDSDKTSQGSYPERRARDIKEVIDRLQLGPVILVAWSMAGPEAISLIDQFGSDSLRALILVDSTIGGDPDPARFTPHFNNVKALQLDRQGWTERWVRSMFVTPPTDAVVQKIAGDSFKTPTDTMALLILNTYVVSGDDRRASLSKLTRPLLYIAREGNEAQARVAKTAVPSARIEVLSGAGHAMFVEAAERFNKALSDFISAL